MTLILKLIISDNFAGIDLPLHPASQPLSEHIKTTSLFRPLSSERERQKGHMTAAISPQAVPAQPTPRQIRSGRAGHFFHFDFYFLLVCPKGYFTIGILGGIDKV